MSDGGSACAYLILPDAIDHDGMRIFVRFRVAEGFSCPVDRRDPKGKDATSLLAKAKPSSEEAVEWSEARNATRRSTGFRDSAEGPRVFPHPLAQGGSDMIYYTSFSVLGL